MQVAGNKNRKVGNCVTPVGTWAYEDNLAYNCVDFLTIRAGSAQVWGRAFSAPGRKGGNSASNIIRKSRIATADLGHGLTQLYTVCNSFLCVLCALCGQKRNTLTLWLNISSGERRDSVHLHHPALAGSDRHPAGAFVSAASVRLCIQPDTTDPGPVRHRRSGRFLAACQIQVVRRQKRLAFLRRPLDHQQSREKEPVLHAPRNMQRGRPHAG